MMFVLSFRCQKFGHPQKYCRSPTQPAQATADIISLCATILHAAQM